jgi:hypothetical protein
VIPFGGLGYVYLDRWRRAYNTLAAWLVLSFLTAYLSPGLLSGLLALGLVLYTTIDAYRKASQ